MNFSKVLYFPSSHCQLSLSHRLIFFCPLLRASAGVGAEKPIIPATPAACPRRLCGTFQGHEIISSVTIFTYFFLSVCRRPDAIISCSAAFFFSFEKGNVFRFVLQKKKSKKRKNKRLFYPILAVLSLWRFTFCRSIYLICCLFMFLWVFFFESAISISWVAHSSF